MKLLIIISSLIVAQGYRVDLDAAELINIPSEILVNEKLIATSEEPENSVTVEEKSEEKEDKQESIFVPSVEYSKFDKQKSKDGLRDPKASPAPAPVEEIITEDTPTTPIFANRINNQQPPTAVYLNLNGQGQAPAPVVSAAPVPAPVIMQLIPQYNSPQTVPFLVLRPFVVPINNPNVLQNSFGQQPILTQPVYQTQPILPVQQPQPAAPTPAPVQKPVKNPSPVKKYSQLRPILTIKQISTGPQTKYIPHSGAAATAASSIKPISTKLASAQTSKYAAFQPPSYMDDTPFMPMLNSPFSGSNARVKKQSTPLSLVLNTNEYLPELNKEFSSEEAAKINIQVQRA